MTTRTQSLAEFLLARIAEDEARVREFREIYGSADVLPDLGGYAVAGAARVLAECEAKRRIIATFDRYVGHARAERDHETAILKALALPYADHPGFREEWRP